MISVSFALSLVLPRAPYSDRKVDGKKASRRSSCCYGWKVFKPIFSMKMLLNLPHIIPSASIVAIIEMVCFMFLKYNTEDKTSLSPLGLPMFVLATYQLVCFLLNICRCKKCYGNREADNSSRCCGSFTNIILISASTALVVLGYFADNNMLFPSWPPFLKNFSLYFSVAVALAITSTLLAKQRKSLLVTNTEVYYYLLSEDQRFYDATKVVQTLFVFMYHGIITGLLISKQDPWVLDRQEIRSIVYYYLVPGQLVGSLGLALFV